MYYVWRNKIIFIYDGNDIVFCQTSSSFLSLDRENFPCIFLILPTRSQSVIFLLFSQIFIRSGLVSIVGLKSVIYQNSKELSGIFLFHFEGHFLINYHMNLFFELKLFFWQLCNIKKTQSVNISNKSKKHFISSIIKKLI